MIVALWALFGFPYSCLGGFVLSFDVVWFLIAGLGLDIFCCVVGGYGVLAGLVWVLLRVMLDCFELD